MTGSKAPSRRDIILDVIALLGGALFSLSLSPLGFWPLAFASPVALYAVTQEGSVRRTILRFYLYNVGLFGVGVSWIFVSINEYGNASVPLSGILVLLFVLAYSLICVPQAVLRRSLLLGAVGDAGMVSILVSHGVPVVVCWLWSDGHAVGKYCADCRRVWR